MKKYLICIILVTIGTFQLNAQIQRQFFGYSFGASRQVVLQGMKGKGFEIHNTSNGFMAYGSYKKPLIFGGYEWEFVSFKFYKNRLYDVSFCITTKHTSSQIIINHYNDLIKRLDYKYAQCKREIYDDLNAQWSDNKTGVICRYMYLNSEGDLVEYPTRKVNMYLWYYDFNGNKQKWDNDDSDL